jgi:hypothetical protein
MTHDPNAPEPLVTSAEDGELRALLEAGRDELPTTAQLGGLAAKLGPILGPGGPGGHGGGGAAAAAKAGASGAIAKVLGAVTIAVVVGGGAVHSFRTRATSEAIPTTQSTSAVVAVTPMPNAAPPEEPPPPAPSPPVVAVAPRPTPHAAPRATTAVEDPNAEVTLLQGAHSALPSDPARTLAICAEHARRFPDGLMAQEREVLAIEALVKTGRTDDARARADRFAAAYPSSTHLRRIHAVLGDAP